MTAARHQRVPAEPWAAPRPTVNEVVRGALAFVLLIALVIGMPAALVALSAALQPFDGLKPSTVGSALTSPDDGSLFLAALTLVAWTAWLVFAVSVGLEIVAFVRGVPTPRLPFLKLPQQGAAALVATTALLVTSGATLLSPPIARPVAAAVLDVDTPSGAAGAVTLDRPAATTVLASQQHPTVVVRRHDTLWSLAEKHLGSGERYREIVALNTGRAQPDGRSLTDARWVYPGWVLQLPSDAHGLSHSSTRADGPVAERVVEPGDTLWGIAEEELGSGRRYGELYDHNHGHAQLDGSRLVDADVIRPGWKLELPAMPPEVAPAPAPDVPRPATSSPPDIARPPVAVGTAPTPSSTADDGAASAPSPSEDAGRSAFSLALGLGTITAAGLMWELRRRRRVQQRNRHIGQRIAMPAPDLAVVEARVASTTSAVTAQTVRDALRALMHSCIAAQRVLPDVVLVRVAPSSIVLELQRDEQDAVPPFTAESERIWRLDGPVQLGSNDQDPYPALVTLGVDGDDLLLLNLESVGTLALSGSSACVEAVLRAFAVDLAVGPLSGAAWVTFAACFSDLAATLDPGRVRHVPSIEQAERETNVRVATVHELLAAGDVHNVRVTRSREVSTDASSPEVVIADRTLSKGPAPWSGVSAIVVDPASSDGWSIAVDDSGATLRPLAITFEPQRLAQVDFDCAVSLLTTAEFDPSTAHSPLARVDERTVASDALPEVPGAVLDLRDDIPAPPRVLVLGNVHVERADDEAAPHRRRRATELIAYLALHGGASAHQIDEAMWPGKRVEKTTRSPFISRARQWLGRTSDGEPYLPQVADGGTYRLRADVGCDWHDFVRFAQLGLASGPDGAGALEAALALVRGRPFLGVDPATYTWAEADTQEMISAIVDVAHVLSATRFDAGDFRGAQEAVAKGLLAEPCSELLYQDAIRAAASAGDSEGVDRLAERLRQEIELVDPEDTMDEVTACLIDSCVE